MTKEVDLTDDWMNPSTSSYSVKSQIFEDKTEYFIERCRRQICFGVPGYIDQWETWSIHATPEERDAELEKLVEEHPMWHLRRSARNRYRESIGLCPLSISHPGVNE